MDTLLRNQDHVWLDLVADLMAAPLTCWPREPVALQLAETFEAVGCAFHARPGTEPIEQSLWPVARFAEHIDELTHWSVHESATGHPILRYYLTTGDGRSMQVRDVPAHIAEARVVAAWNERGRRWGGVQSQLAMPVLLRPGSHRAFVLGRADPYTVQEMGLSRRLQRLLTGLDRQIACLAGWSASQGPGGTQVAVEIAADIRLTPRELAVLELLAQGRTAASIGRRLAIAERTVQKHLERSYTKLGVTDRLGAVLRAQRVGLLSPCDPA